MTTARKLRPSSPNEAKEFVRLCLAQQVPLERIRGFLTYLGLSPSLLEETLGNPESSIPDLTDNSISLEIELDELRRSQQEDLLPSNVIPLFRGNKPESSALDPLSTQTQVVLDQRPLNRRSRSVKDVTSRASKPGFGRLAIIATIAMLGLIALSLMIGVSGFGKLSALDGTLMELRLAKEEVILRLRQAPLPFQDSVRRARAAIVEREALTAREDTPSTGTRRKPGK